MLPVREENKQQKPVRTEGNPWGRPTKDPRKERDIKRRYLFTPPLPTSGHWPKPRWKPAPNEMHFWNILSYNDLGDLKKKQQLVIERNVTSMWLTSVSSALGDSSVEHSHWDFRPLTFCHCPLEQHLPCSFCLHCSEPGRNGGEWRETQLEMAVG